jgi:hypothetical protein
VLGSNLDHASRKRGVAISYIAGNDMLHTGCHVQAVTYLYSRLSMFFRNSLCLQMNRTCTPELELPACARVQLHTSVHVGRKNAK